MTTPLEHFTTFFTERMSKAQKGHFAALGFCNPDIQAGKVSLEMPYSEKIIANPETGAVASGALMALVDSCCAIAAATIMDEIKFSPTLDLRVDYMSPTEKGKALIAKAEAYRKTNSVIFTRAAVYQEGSDKPVAHALVNFMPIDFKVAETGSKSE